MATRSLLSDAAPSNAQTQSPRDQANAALEANSASQTSSAAPAPAPTSSSSDSAFSPLSADEDAGTRPSMPRRSTTNYEQAQAAAIADAEQQAQAGEGDGVLRPYLDRHQSWNQSDMRRMMTEKILAAESGAGYSST
ncbi:hypothetical protein LTR28_012986 [Elasticomyces elasticus]|nr:hypothetical protein LTR28_012986 [Elasticomyces elasticus]